MTASATDTVRAICRQVGGLHPATDVTEAEWSEWLQGWGGVEQVAHCPECGDRLVERSGSRGRFVGCESYPDCRYTRSVS